LWVFCFFKNKRNLFQFVLKNKKQTTHGVVVVSMLAQDYLLGSRLKGVIHWMFLYKFRCCSFRITFLGSQLQGVILSSFVVEVLEGSTQLIQFLTIINCCKHNMKWLWFPCLPRIPFWDHD